MAVNVTSTIGNSSGVSTSIGSSGCVGAACKSLTDDQHDDEQDVKNLHGDQSGMTLKLMPLVPT